MNVTYDIPYQAYIICGLASLITAYAVIRQIYLISVKRVPFYKTWGLFLTWLFFAIPAVTYYELISQMAIFPKYVKTVKLDLTHSSFESGLVSDIIKEAKADNAICDGKICTMPVLDFKHNRSEVQLKVSNESDGIIYCGMCASPIDFDFGKMQFVAHIIFR